jgi:hypothetical protein
MLRFGPTRDDVIDDKKLIAANRGSKCEETS